MCNTHVKSTRSNEYFCIKAVNNSCRAALGVGVVVPERHGRPEESRLCEVDFLFRRFVRNYWTASAAIRFVPLVTISVLEFLERLRALDDAEIWLYYEGCGDCWNTRAAWLIFYKLIEYCYGVRWIFIYLFYVTVIVRLYFIAAKQFL